MLFHKIGGETKKTTKNTHEKDTRRTMPCHAMPCQGKFGQLKFVLIKQLGNLLTRPTSEIDWRQWLPVLAQFAFQDPLCLHLAKMPLSHYYLAFYCVDRAQFPHQFPASQTSWRPTASAFASASSPAIVLQILLHTSTSPLRASVQCTVYMSCSYMQWWVWVAGLIKILHSI